MSGAPRFIFSQHYEFELEGHPFDTRKFALTAEILKRKLPQARYIEPDMPSQEDLLPAHTPEWVDKVLNLKMTPRDEELMELPFSEVVSAAHQLAVSGTILACREALETGVGLHIGGGSHHAFADHGEGFCVLNDIACGILKIKDEGLIRRASVIDLDVHQGNGTASIFSKNPDVFTFSMHERDLYPEIKSPGSLDVDLERGTADAAYLKLLRENLDRAFDIHPDLVVYQAGVDVGEEDLLGGLKISKRGLCERDQIVFDACQARKIPVAVTLGGGYQKDPRRTAALHAQTLSIFSGR